MRFTRNRRVRYRNNPLEQVVAQVRFSAVLKLLNEPPSAFQEAMLTDYPGVQVIKTEGISFSMMAGSTPQHSTEVSAYLFSTADGRYTAEVKAESLTLTTTRYEGWEAFWPRFQRLLETFFGLYPVGQINRIGLRYVDVMDREANGLAGVAWADLICSELLGPLSSGHIPADVVGAAQTFYLLSLDDGAALSLRAGLGIKQDNPAETGLNSPRQVFVIDSDFHAPREGYDFHLSSAIDGLRSRFCDFNVQAGGLFEWAASERLKSVLGPEPVE